MHNKRKKNYFLIVTGISVLFFIVLISSMVAIKYHNKQNNTLIEQLKKDNVYPTDATAAKYDIEEGDLPSE